VNQQGCCKVGICSIGSGNSFYEEPWLLGSIHQEPVEGRANKMKESSRFLFLLVEDQSGSLFNKQHPNKYEGVK
jgi:hypothetical protein